MFSKKSNKRSEQIEKLEAKLREEVYYKEFYRNRLDVEEHVKETLMNKLDKVTLMAYDRMEEIERLESELTSMDYQHKSDEERWAEQLESYEESLKRRDLTIVDLKEDSKLAESAYESLLILNSSISKKLCEAGNKIIELESENSHLREELHDSTMEIESLNKHIKEAEHTIITYSNMIDELLAKVERLKRSAGEDY